MTLSPQLLAQFAALKNPDDPAFASALAALQNVDPTTLERADLPTFIALLDSAMEALKAQQAAVGKELTGLRSRAALNAYTQHK
jgi:hypothetical protein